MSKLPAREIPPGALLKGRAGSGLISASTITNASASISSDPPQYISHFAVDNGYFLYYIDEINEDIDNIRTYLTASQETTQVDFYNPGDVNTGSIQYVVSTVNDDGATQVDAFSTGSFTNFIYDYSLYSLTSGSRAGQFMVTTFNGSIDFTDTSTKHLNDSSIPSIDAAISGDEIRVKIISGSGYRFKALVKKL